MLSSFVFIAKIAMCSDSLALCTSNSLLCFTLLHVTPSLLYPSSCRHTITHLHLPTSSSPSPSPLPLSPPAHPAADNFNRYVRLNGDVVGTGGCVRHRHDEHVTKVTDSTPVIRLLSTDNNREGGKNDWLCLVMKDIVSVGSLPGLDAHLH